LFTRPKGSLIVSSEGFSVEVVGRDELRYEEGGRSVMVYSSYGELYGKRRNVVDPTSIKSWNDGTKIDRAGRVRIFDNIRRAYRAMGEDVLTLGANCPDVEEYMGEDEE
jgi:hypothetical protein